MVGRGRGWWTGLDCQKLTENRRNPPFPGSRCGCLCSSGVGQGQGTLQLNPNHAIPLASIDTRLSLPRDRRCRLLGLHDLRER